MVRPSDAPRGGGFVLIDPATNRTVAAGMIRGQVKSYESPQGKYDTEISSNVTWEQRSVTRAMREERNGHEATCLWLTGLSGSGKTTVAKKLEQELFAEGKQVYLLDGDNVRHGLNGDLGFSEKERREVRDAVKALFPEGAFKEIHVQCDLEVCKQRDPKGLYKKAAAGEIKDFTGVSAPYEKPMTPDLTIDSVELQPVEAVRVIRQKLL